MSENTQENVIHVDFGKQEESPESPRPVSRERKLTRRQKFMRRTVPTIATAAALATGLYYGVHDESKANPSEFSLPKVSPIEQLATSHPIEKVSSGSIILTSKARLRDDTTRESHYDELSEVKEINGVNVEGAEAIEMLYATVVAGEYMGYDPVENGIDPVKRDHREDGGLWKPIRVKYRVTNQEATRFIYIGEETIKPGVVDLQGSHWIDVRSHNGLMGATENGETIPEYKFDQVKPIYHLEDKS